jgi:tetratricopeptide (TPR) repeat protein
MTWNREMTEERDDLLDRIASLDREFADGSLTKDEYQGLRDELTHQAATVIRRLGAQIEEVEAPASTAQPAQPAPAGQQPARRHRESPVFFGRLWMLAIGAFVAVTVAVLVTVSATRSGNDEVTGSTPADVNSLIADAQRFTGEGKSLDAIKAYDAVLQRDPANVQALAYRGWLVRLAGLPNEGLKSIDRAIELQPAYPDARFFKGYILLRDQQQPQQAVVEFETFLSNNPPREMVPLVQQALDDAKRLAATATNR